MRHSRDSWLTRLADKVYIHLSCIFLELQEDLPTCQTDRLTTTGEIHLQGAGSNARGNASTARQYINCWRINCQQQTWSMLRSLASLIMISSFSIFTYTGSLYLQKKTLTSCAKI